MAAAFKPHSRLDISAANSSLLSGTLQRAVKATFASYVTALAEPLKLRQGVVATAVVYLRRFYARCSFMAHDPRHVAPACLFLAAKVEESAVTAKSMVHAVQAVRDSWACNDRPLSETYRLDETALNQKELVLIEALDFQLVVAHPYQHLEDVLLADASLEVHTLRCLQLANDTYRFTDLCLMQPVQVVAVACLVLAVGATAEEVPAWTRRVQGAEPDAVLAAIAELLEGYAQPRLDAFACEVALASDA